MLDVFKIMLLGCCLAMKFEVDAYGGAEAKAGGDFDGAVAEGGAKSLGEDGASVDDFDMISLDDDTDFVTFAGARYGRDEMLLDGIEKVASYFNR